MKMNHMMKRCVTFVIACVLAVSSVGVTGYPVEIVEAATVQSITKSTQVVCKKTAKVKIPSGYKNCKFTSSNPKVATVDKKGNFKALRLGVTKLTVQSGAKKKNYMITVVPAKKSDVRLNQEMIISGQKCQLKLVSDKYDTSQVKLIFDDINREEVSKTGIWKWKVSGVGSAYINYSYGSFSKTTLVYMCDKDVIFAIFENNNEWNDSGIEAGVSYDVDSLKMELFDESLSYKQLKKKGITILLDGKPLPDKMIFTPGTHKVTIVAGKQKYSKNESFSYSVKNALLKKDATGYSDTSKEVFDAAFAAVDQVIKDGMSEEEKVKAIHDYLIYSANYVNNGDYESAENWAYGACGVLIHKEGVCQSYAIAFYMMASAAGLDCQYVTGTAKGGGHAWNQVKVDGTWYYIDCTWDDPIMNGHSGGGERYTYYLSETLWSNHTANTIKDLADDSKYLWENYYLTGEGYNCR